MCTRCISTHLAQNIICFNTPPVFFVAEQELGTQCIIEMDQQQTIIHQPTTLDKLER